MSHYKPYPAYKDSGVEWLGRVPEHWDICSVKRVASICYGIGEPPGYKPEGTPLIRATNVDAGKIRNEGLVYVDPAEIPGRRAVWLAPGDIIVVRSGAYTGDSAIVRQEHCPSIAGFDMVIRTHGVDPDFLQYALLSNYLKSNQIDLEKMRAAQPHLNAEELGACFVLLPSELEQKRVVVHIDRETARIDALIEKKARFIELLREKRQALITHAVTKGLDPNVKMKDSGVEWLEEVPEHWEALPLRRVVTAVKTGGTPSEEQPSPDADGLAWYTPGDFGNSLVLSSSEKRVSALAVSTGEAKVYPAGAVLVVSIGATLGKVGYLVDSASANQQINAVIPNSRVNGYFLSYSLSVKTEAMWFLANAATIGIMNQEKTKEIWLAVPSPSEQKAITDYLDKGTGRLDSLIGKTERSIELLKERRSALITAAVTGQIDLREAV